MAARCCCSAALVALLPFGLGFFRTQFAAITGDPRRYWPIFRDLSRWSLIGVALTEVTVNAHAYLVTFISGASSFALLALGMLLMRPASLMQSALPDLERPAMSRAIAAGDMAALSRIQRHFTWGLIAAWLVNVLLCVALLAFFPLLVLKKGYALHDVILVAILSSVIMAIRAWRTPLAVLLQAAGQFKELAGIGTVSGALSVFATLALLLTLGPIASLGGILLGELVILARVIQMARDWKRPMADTRHHLHPDLQAPQNAEAPAGRDCRAENTSRDYPCWWPTMMPKAMRASTFAIRSTGYRWPLTRGDRGKARHRPGAQHA